MSLALRKILIQYLSAFLKAASVGVELSPEDVIVLALRAQLSDFIQVMKSQLDVAGLKCLLVLQPELLHLADLLPLRGDEGREVG